MLQTATDLQKLLDRARTCGRIALDTEFVWTDTYTPNLGVVQAGFGPDECFLIDAIAARDIEPFAEIMRDRAIVKIIHDAPQDLRILQAWCGAIPANVFDTRAAGGFLGMDSTISLVKLLREVVGVELAKTESRTDWLQRPLSPEQVEYAKDDVRHMFAVHDKFCAELNTLGRQAWLAADMAELENPGLYAERDPREAYKRIKGGNRLGRGGFAILRELAEWRELLCRELNLAKNRIASDVELLIASELGVENFSRLSQKDDFRPRTLRKYGNEMFECASRALASDPTDWPEPNVRNPDTGAMKKRINAVYDALAEKCRELKLDPALVSSKGDIADLVRFPENLAKKGGAVMRGWRGEVFGGFISEAITAATASESESAVKSAAASSSASTSAPTSELASGSPSAAVEEGEKPGGAA